MHMNGNINRETEAGCCHVGRQIDFSEFWQAEELLINSVGPRPILCGHCQLHSSCSCINTAKPATLLLYVCYFVTSKLKR